MNKSIITLVSLIAILALLLIGLNLISSNDSNNDNSQEQTSEAAPSETAPGVVSGIEDAKTNLQSISEDTNPVATMILTEADVDYEFTFELFPAKAPQTVYNFIELANSGFYDGLTMHRLVQDFVIQGGDPDGTGAGGPGYAIKGEFPSNGVETGLTHQVGALAMARSANPDSAGSQFYIVLNDGVQSLDNDYAIMGYMITGYENLEHFNNAAVKGSTPIEPITIKSISVDTKGETYPSPDKIK